MEERNKNLFKTNNIVYGFIVGLVVPALMIALLQYLVLPAFGDVYWLSKGRVVYLLSLIPNLILIRLFLVNLKLENAGKGILIVSFVIMLLIFVLIKD